ncbi:hypothetical protein [Saccharomonospora sp. CUA-673]|uniref:hypothetical protein n=1 Tax=Saccharomonospora sp. CUA-673 TaxID=1904969 RepID=UPI00111508AA|nr:hypothetical protein [Saccharomonospora sp. CUA-673]
MDPTSETTIVASVIAALARSFTTDAWAGFKEGLGRVLGRGNKDDAAREEEQLERDKDRLLAAQDDSNTDIANRVDAKWTIRLQEFLEEHPEHFDELRALAYEYGDGSASPAASQSVVNRNVAMGGSRIISSGIGDVNVHLPRGE